MIVSFLILFLSSSVWEEFIQIAELFEKKKEQFFFFFLITTKVELCWSVKIRSTLIKPATKKHLLEEILIFPSLG